ncbi:alpha/beta hydrolase [Pseudonocardia sp.]|uniref:alpha/beta hydrolase n=1 Tax=Pseudonocardia sp. TaxID=60912 RepID=UPI00262D119D|nr:alpha/beta hydrolase [Pseudonocardia sp.]
MTAALGAAVAATIATSSVALAHDQVVEVPISFAVQNTNTTTVPCTSDGGDYTVRGTLVAPREAVESGGSVSLLLHAVTFDQDYWQFDGVEDYNVARQLAEEGHAIVAVDRLGYGTSDRPAGLDTCFGSEADVAHQMVQALRSGDYELGGADGTSFEHVYLGGSSVGGLISNLAAAHYGDVDGVLNLSWGDFAASPYGALEVADASRRCLLGGDPGAEPDYAVFAKDSIDTFYFNSAEQAVRDAVPAPNADPCGQVLSLGPALTVDSLMLARIDVPVLVQFGDADAIFPPPAADLQAARYLGSPEVTKSIIADASHYPVLEANHAQVVADVDAWLDARSG